MDNAELDELSKQIQQAMLKDRHRFRQRMRGIRSARKQQKPFDRNLNRLQKELEKSVALREQRQQSRPAIIYDETLPVFERKDEIAAAIAEHQVVIVCGETGSGKSTQLPKICLEMGRGIEGTIGHTQPRRIAARSIAARLATELKCQQGEQVGFKVRFTDTTNPATHIKLMTDGILLAETQHDRFLNQYDTIIVDEAHERSLNIDFLLGCIKRILPKRPELRLVITSATIDAERFSEHFPTGNQPAPVILVEGRTYPVEVRYRPLEADENSGEADWRQSLVDAVEELEIERAGDILVFLPTERDIREAAKALRGWQTNTRRNEREILPLYGRLSTSDQNKIFNTSSRNRLVLATNVAESSLTVPGIDAVIDVGTARISRYSARAKMQRLPIEPVSKASADQRKGRCGRVGPGICIRLYSELDYLSRGDFTPPEIQRSNLASVILQTMVLNLGTIEEFPFLEPPRPAAINDGYRTLFELGAIDDRNELTETGRQLAKLPVDPRIGRMVLAGHEQACLHEVLIIASALEVQDPRDRPHEKQKAADEAHEKFAHESSDFLTYLNIWDFFHKAKRDLSKSQLRKACLQNFLSYNRLREWADVHQQLLRLIEDFGLKQGGRSNNADAIHKALLTGLLANIATLTSTHEYTGAGGSKLFLWPGSALFGQKPKWVMAGELLETTKRYARTVAKINSDWIEPMAVHLVKRSYSDPYWSRKKGSTMANERVTLFGLPVVPRRVVRYGPADAITSRELMIRDGLVTGEFDTSGEFLERNQQLVEEAEQLQHKTRRHDLLLGEEARFEFYDARIPADIWDTKTFERWRVDAEASDANILYMTLDDLVVSREDVSVANDFPDFLQVENVKLQMEYHLEPGSEQDGATMIVSEEVVALLQPQLLEWGVPGTLEEKVTALIKSLPKSQRVMFVPVPDTTREVISELTYGQGAFLQELARLLTRIGGEPVSPKSFDLNALPAHLRMNVRVVDHSGSELVTSRDLLQLRQQFATKANPEAFQKPMLDDTPTDLEKSWQREGVTQWDFGDRPTSVLVVRDNQRVELFPAIIDRTDSVQLALLTNTDEAMRLSANGIARLLELSSGAETLEALMQNALFPLVVESARTVLKMKDADDQMLTVVSRRLLATQDSLPRTKAEFESFCHPEAEQLAALNDELLQLVREIIDEAASVRVARGNITLPIYETAAADIDSQLAELISADFLVSTPADWLSQLPRFLKGIIQRCEKLVQGCTRHDEQQRAELSPFWKNYLGEKAKHTGSELPPELQTYRWMIEEYRVELFASDLGTSVTVSPKRLNRQFKKATR